MQCHESASLLSPYLDDTLPSAAELDALEAHLSACEPCRSRLASLRALKHAIARLPSREEPPGAIRAHVEALRLGRSRFGRRRALVPAVAAVVALAVVAAYALRRADRTARLADDLVADHVSSVPEVRLAEIASSDREAIARFFADHLPFPVAVPAIPGAEILGARLCKIEGRRVELLFYRREDRTLSLFVTDSPIAGGECWAARGHHVCGRRQGGITMLLVGQLPAAELRRLLEESAL